MRFQRVRNEKEYHAVLQMKLQLKLVEQKNRRRNE